LEWLYVRYFAGGFCRPGPVFGPGALSLHRCADGLSKQLLHAKREAHVTRNPELAAHECDLPVELARRRPLLDELRAMAVLEPGPDPKRLARAKAIRFHLQGQEWASLSMREKLDEVYRFLEVLLSARRWRDPPLSIDGMRSEIKGACSRISRLLSGRARAV